MDGGPPWRRHRERCGWPDIGPAGVYVTVGGFLTVLTMTLCFSNAVTTKQAIALALPAAVITLRGWIGIIIVPDTFAAWRKGFREGCRAAQMADSSATAAASQIPPNPGDAAVTDLVARWKPRTGRRTRPGTSYQYR
jgi:hypothetical protein